MYNLGQRVNYIKEGMDTEKDLKIRHWFGNWDTENTNALSNFIF